jgi:alpha-L-rhamnosidase
MRQQNYKLRQILFISFAYLLMHLSTALAGTQVNDLRVEYLKNPVGIDVQKPRFSWKMESSDRGAIQTAYEITVSTDPDGESVVWNSTRVTSSESVHIEYGGSDLLPSTRYFWTVRVWDEQEQEITSGETAFFETGLKDSGWSNAQWIKSTLKPQGGTESGNKYTIEMKFEIVSGAAGVIFSAKDKANFFMWQINLEKEEGKTYFRPHVWRNNAPALLIEKDITDIINVQKGTEYTFRIEIDGDIAHTYINDNEIDFRQNPNEEDYPYGLLGFRAGSATEDAYFDDIKITTKVNGVNATLFEEDFSNASNSSFLSAVVELGRLHSNQGLVWQKTAGDQISKYKLEMDFEIVDIAAGPIFGAKDNGQNFFMWQISLDKVAGKTTLRPHSWQNGGGANHADKDITDIISIQAGQTYRLRIEIDGDKASTYIDNLLVDENRTNPRGGNYGYGDVGLGFRADIGENNRIPEKSYYDNILVSTEIDGTWETYFSEDFSSPEDHAFTAGTVTEGRLLLEGASNTNFSWQKKAPTGNLHFAVNTDLTLMNDNAGIIFSAKDATHFYMWAVNTHDGNEPVIRRHFYNGGNPVYSDTGIGNYFSKSDLLNTKRNLKIEVTGNVIKTFIDEQLVDTYNDGNNQASLGGLGFRAYYGNNTDEIACWDNIVYTNYVEGTPVVIFSEDFETGNNPFDGGELVTADGNTQLKMFSRNGDTRAFDDSANGIPLFRTEFNLAKEIRSARLYSSALGVYDVFINGQRVGTPSGNGEMIYDEFKPGWTDYSKTIFYTTYDVTDLLTQGGNAVGASVSSGWWNGAIAHGEYGSPSLGFIARLRIEYADGSTEDIVTNPETWLSSTDSPVRIGDIYAGETYDARKEKDWTSPDFDDSEWYQTGLNTDFNGEIKAFTGPPVQVRPELQRQPVKITQYEGSIDTGTTYGAIDVKESYETPTAVSLIKGQTVIYDLGQNMVGWVKFKVKGNAGTKMKIRFAEMLNDDGSNARGNDGPGESLYTINLRGAKATLNYILKGESEGEEFQPSTSFFGFRYCDITATGDIEIESLTGEVVGTVAEEGSSFVTSHAAVNQLYQNVIWGQRSNFLSVPTDCPQRDERLGWTGDIQVFGRAATYNADLAAFFHKWMGDMRDSQRSDGAYPDVAPHAWVGWGQAAWAEAGLVVPWNVYLMYNDADILKENYESMEKYMVFLSNQTGDGYKYNGAGTNYGDWVAYVSTDSRYVSVCYYAYAALLMEKISNALSEAENDVYAQKAASYRTLYDNIKTEFQKRYVITSGRRLTINTQTAYLLALRLDLFATESAREEGIKQLESLIKNNGYKLNTGFVGTGTLNQTLSDVGLTDVAYNLLLQRNNPSWLYSVDQGATTIWERWDSYTKERGFHSDISMNSFNHYAYGAVSEWMYRYMAGINPDENNPGFKHILISPLPDVRQTRPDGQERITKADATYNSCYGPIRSAWEIDSQENVKYTVHIPANTTATLTLILSSDNDEVFENDVPVSEAEGVISFRMEESKAIVELQSGDYLFEMRKGTGISPEKLHANQSEIFIYPNPVEDVMSFNSEKEITDVRIYKSNGILVYAQKSGLPVNVHSFASGVYFVQINKKNPETIRIIKK